ncbi:uncharacterized protein LOC131685426 [Topomyia yanbarensis]|uniref:uncharacterized protein LOC131685426 n=1 Tax=Topomyia yanbarensis TaxID=2498891 RepID=UPI00273B38D8|nr:uncharacterized protein LOC131685426 [Topomyia yanbarensis]
MAGTMDELLEELNYDFNYLLHEVRTAMRQLDQSQRRTVEAWLHKLANTNQSLEEVRLRNDFLFYLSRNCNDGNLLPPFDQKPPSGYVLDATHLLPVLGTSAATTSKPLYEAHTGSPSGTARRAELFERSPDGGAFLVSQPVPRCGAFCYLAIVSKPPKS